MGFCEERFVRVLDFFLLLFHAQTMEMDFDQIYLVHKNEWIVGTDEYFKKSRN